ncbi:MAG TPA: GNVR domain-containing protein [Candidatus Sulfotelmatobacter sp.]|nr:GNVR domain-containing protein [Candidatus Sulfotelmatobacter sp.]
MTTEVSLLDISVLLVRDRRFILRFVGGAALLSIIISLVLPVKYEAKVVLMPPQPQTSSMASALLSGLGSVGSVGSLGSLGSLAGGLGSLGIKTQSDLYVSLLKTRTVEDAMIRRFNLMSEYRLKRMSDARKEFERRTTVLAGTKDNLITITLEDRDPERAAQLANGYVEEFRKLSASLAITEAARRRLFFEQQLQPAKENLAEAEEAMRKTQQTTGVLQIDSQARALIESAAVLRAQVTAKEVQIEAMRSYAAEDNPDLILVKQQLSALQKQLQQLAGSDRDPGSDIILSKGRVTGSGLEFIRRYRDLKYHETVYELLTKGLELAKLDEARQGEVLQTVDAAVPPDKKSFPPRTVIVVLSTLIAFLIAIFWITTREAMRRAFAAPENRRRLEAMKLYWKAKSRK